MQTIMSSVEEILRSSPWLMEALASDIVNLSGLARQLKTELEKKNLRPFTNGAITMALKRLQSTLPTQKSLKAGQVMQSLTVRSNIIQYAFRNSPTLLQAQKALLEAAKGDEGACVFFARGTFDTGIIVNDGLENLLKKFTAKELLIKKFRDLSYISIRFQKDITHIAGVYYPFFQTLAWHGLNIIQIVAGFEELGFLFDKKEVDRAFTVLKALTED